MFVDLVPVYEIVLLALWGAAFSCKMSHSSAIEAGPFGFHWGSLSLGDVGSEGSSVEPIRWGASASRHIHGDRLVSHPSWGVTGVVLVLGWPLISSEWRAESLSLSEGWERSWVVWYSSVRLENIDDLSGFGGTDGPSFDFVVIAQFGVEFQ